MTDSETLIALVDKLGVEWEVKRYPYRLVFNHKQGEAPWLRESQNIRTKVWSLDYYLTSHEATCLAIAEALRRLRERYGVTVEFTSAGVKITLSADAGNSTYWGDDELAAVWAAVSEEW